MAEAKKNEVERPPNQRQIRYAIKRLEAIIDKKLRLVNRWMNDKRKGTLSDREKVIRIGAGKAGKLKLPPHATREPQWGKYDVPGLLNCFSFPEDEAQKKMNRKLLEEVEAKKQVIRREGQDLMDELALGDAPTALNLIREFEAKAV